MYIDIYIYIIYIHIHVFSPAQDSSVWLVLTSREQLMSPECSKHQVLSFAKMLVVNEQKNKIKNKYIYPENKMEQLAYVTLKNYKKKFKTKC